MIKLLVTGSTGFIGRQLLSRFSSSKFEIINLNHSHGEIWDEMTWVNLPRVDTVIHMAAKTFVPDSWTYPQDFLKVNFQGAVCALEYCRKHHASLIFLSSYMYGEPKFLPIPESAEVKAFNPYGLAKKLAEELCEFYTSQYNVDVTILRPFNVYGPGQSSDFLIPFIIQQAMEGKKIIVKDLEPKRDYIFVEDLVNFIFEAVNARLRGINIFNVGTGVSYSVAEIITLVQNILGTDLNVESTGQRRNGEVMDTRADMTKANTLLKFIPSWSLQEGLAVMISKMISNSSEK
jgi:GDP-4-dehydro-6-deoxy-D-mannose reductase